MKTTSSSSKAHDNLQVSVQVIEGTYECDKALEARTMPNPTVVSGGNIYQTVAIQKQCSSSEQDGEAWVFVKPTCGIAGGIARDNIVTAEDMLQETVVPIQYGSSSNGSSYDYNNTQDRSDRIPTITIAHCEIEDECQVEYVCANFTCSGLTSCDVDIPDFVINSTSDSTTTYMPGEECLPRDFSMELDNGEVCEFNLMCTSDICIEGTCRAERLNDFQVCDE
ncbi:hypothetical protein (Partial), partial [Seminavis robusta]|eukprot:Sro2303_g322530.1 n/a (222) ;mRNA; r:2-667